MTRVRTTVSGRGRGRPPGPPVDPAVRREEILDAAERVIARTGAELSFADIATEAGFARTAIYAAFADRPTLVHELAERHTQRIILQANEILAQPRPVKELLAELIDLISGFVEDNSRLHFLLMQAFYVDEPSGHGRPLFTRTADWATLVFEALFDRLGADPALVRSWASATVGAILLAAEDWSANSTTDRARLVDNLTAFLWPALSAIGADDLTGPLLPGLPDK
ncbi:TetR family transcriptional regulator [Antrihabitans stalactiti]|uniref:TetR family transcriptional regulator n=1 Tax=Antrihabitans stalactiti TaxID=2584121 RepID=UPI00146CC472